MLVPDRLRQQSSRHVDPVEASKPPSRTSNVIMQTRDGPTVNGERGESATLLCSKSQSQGNVLVLDVLRTLVRYWRRTNEIQLFSVADPSDRACLGIPQPTGNGAAAAIRCIACDDTRPGDPLRTRPPNSNLLDARRPPIPLMRNIQRLPKIVATPDVAMADAEVQVPDNRASERRRRRSKQTATSA